MSPVEPALYNRAEIQKTPAKNLAHPCTFFANKVQGFAAQNHPLTPAFPRHYVRFATLHFLATMCKVSGPVQKTSDAGPCPAGLFVFENRSRVFRTAKGRPTAAPRLNRLRMADRAGNSQGFILQWLTAMCRLWPSQIALPQREMAEAPNLFSQIILRFASPGPHGPRGGEARFRPSGRAHEKGGRFETASLSSHILYALVPAKCCHSRGIITPAQGLILRTTNVRTGPPRPEPDHTVRTAIEGFGS